MRSGKSLFWPTGFGYASCSGNPRAAHCRKWTNPRGVMSYSSINLVEKLKKFSDHWSPKVIAEMNDYQLKLAKLQGEFVWHKHADTDEVFLCLTGTMKIELRDGIVTLGAGDLFVVPKGIDHKPVAEGECHVLLIEPKGVINTGDAESVLTAKSDDWI